VTVDGPHGKQAGHMLPEDDRAGDRSAVSIDHPDRPARAASGRRRRCTRTGRTSSRHEQVGGRTAGRRDRAPAARRLPRRRRARLVRELVEEHGPLRRRGGREQQRGHGELRARGDHGWCAAPYFALP
jgi:hypothetical protein